MNCDYKVVCGWWWVCGCCSVCGVACVCVCRLVRGRGGDLSPGLLYRHIPSHCPLQSYESKALLVWRSHWRTNGNDTGLF